MKLVKSKLFKENLVVCAGLKQKHELLAVFDERFLKKYSSPKAIIYIKTRINHLFTTHTDYPDGERSFLKTCG